MTHMSKSLVYDSAGFAQQLKILKGELGMVLVTVEACKLSRHIHLLCMITG